MREKYKVCLFMLCSLISLVLVSACNKSTIGRLVKKKQLDSTSYQLIWSDEFEKGGSFDQKKWSYAPRGKVAWNKYMTHTLDYVFQADDKLVMRMDDAQIVGDDVPFHAGGVQSMGKFNLRYGKVEVRAKFSGGRGSWPAIWMMPEPEHSLGGWPAGGEIDIMEHVNHEDVVHQTIHNNAVTDADGGSKATHKTQYDKNGYNTYSIVWNPSGIHFYVNEVLEYTYQKPHDATIQQWPFDVPFYIILNQAGGAGWPGPITKADLPFTMSVDYVRVYDLPLQELASIVAFKPVNKKNKASARKNKIKMRPATVNNAGFESSDLQPWTAWGNSTVSQEAARTGEYGIQSLGGETAIEQIITGLKPNTTYRFGGFAKVGAKGVVAMLGVKDYGGSALNAQVTDTTFTEVSVSFKTGPDQTSAVVYFYKEGIGSAFADDFYFK